MDKIYVIAFFFAFVIAFLITPIARKLAIKVGADRKSTRLNSSHL